MEFKFNNKDIVEGIESKNCIFVDGTSDLIDDSKDLELSHWIPNKTPKQFKADTSTQICYNYIKAVNHHDFDWVLNNHLDVDGILSAFVIMHPEFSLKYEKVISGASLMGDFSAYGDFDTSHFYTHLVEFIKEGQKAKQSNQLIFENGFLMIQDYFNDQIYSFDELAKSAFSQIDQSNKLLRSGQITRVTHSSSFVSYKIPYKLVLESDKQAIYKAGFDFGLDTKQILPMQLLNQHDFEKQKLLIVETKDTSHYYDVLLPDYLWAETSSLYRTSGVQSTDSTNVHVLNRPDLIALTKQFNNMETNKGCWTLADTFHPFASIKGRGFPVVLSFMLDDVITPSSIMPKDVIDSLSRIF